MISWRMTFGAFKLLVAPLLVNGGLSSPDGVFLLGAHFCVLQMDRVTEFSPREGFWEPLGCEPRPGMLGPSTSTKSAPTFETGGRFMGTRGGCSL